MLGPHRPAQVRTGFSRNHGDDHPTFYSGLQGSMRYLQGDSRNLVLHSASPQ